MVPASAVRYHLGGVDLPDGSKRPNGVCNVVGTVREGVTHGCKHLAQASKVIVESN